MTTRAYRRLPGASGRPVRLLGGPWPGLLLLAAGLGGLIAPAATAGNDLPWQRIRDGGHVVLLRHALAPGTGDPPGFELGDCATQRNLNQAGHRQARRIGQRLRSAGLDGAPVFTSQWCRCRDTAADLGLGEAQVLTALNSFYGRREARDERVSALRDFLAERQDAATAVLVTHQVTITAVADVFPSSGEAVIARVADGGRLEVLGSMTTPAP